MGAYEYEVKSIDGQPTSLATYEGKVTLFVNVASKCGLTPQYTKLEALHRRFAPQGFAVLGFPANDFAGQEPDSESEIQSFCSTKYDVTFPLFAKVTVKGPNKTPVYEYLTSHASPPGEIAWNFGKFLVGKDGEVIARFEPTVAPDAPEVIAAIEKALASG